MDRLGANLSSHGKRLRPAGECALEHPVLEYHLTDGHGVRRYPFGMDTQVDIYCPPRSSPTVRPRPSSTPHAR